MASTNREVLVALLRSTGGNSWRRKDNWDTDTELKTWYRVKVDDQGFVVHLDLTGNNLRGILRPMALRNVYRSLQRGALPPSRARCPNALSWG